MKACMPSQLHKPLGRPYANGSVASHWSTTRIAVFNISALYQSLHARHGVQCSMTDGYDCYQNALAERINGILKTELLLSSPENLEQARKMVAEAVQIYNTERPHMALKTKRPMRCIGRFEAYRPT